MEVFIEQIKKNLERNGFPEKKVSLPTEKLYEVADSKSLSLNKVLEKMKKQDHIHYSIGDEKIIFSKVSINSSELPNVNPEMMEKVQEMMAQMDPEELERIQEQVSSMGPEEKEKMMKQAKDMGLF